jgi:hypothetical protein
MPSAGQSCRRTTSSGSEPPVRLRSHSNAARAAGSARGVDGADRRARPGRIGVVVGGVVRSGVSRARSVTGLVVEGLVDPRWSTLQRIDRARVWRRGRRNWRHCCGNDRFPDRGGRRRHRACARRERTEVRPLAQRAGQEALVRRRLGLDDALSRGVATFVGGRGVVAARRQARKCQADESEQQWARPGVTARSLLGVWAKG